MKADIHTWVLVEGNIVSELSIYKINNNNNIGAKFLDLVYEFKTAVPE